MEITNSNLDLQLASLTKFSVFFFLIISRQMQSQYVNDLFQIPFHSASTNHPPFGAKSFSLLTTPYAACSTSAHFCSLHEVSVMWRQAVACYVPAARCSTEGSTYKEDSLYHFTIKANCLFTPLTLP